MSQYQASDVLSALQRGGRSAEQAREQWVKEILEYAKLLQEPEIHENLRSGLAQATLGGLFFNLRQLEAVFDLPDLASMEETYARGELVSYPETQTEVNRSVVYYNRLGINIDVARCGFGNGETRYRITSPSVQVTTSGQRIAAGQLLPSSDREVPLLARTLYEGR